MAETLRKLVSNDFLRTMYENLERWQRDYNIILPLGKKSSLTFEDNGLLSRPVFTPMTNSCDQNLSFCLEFIEQVAKMQGQLFGILTTTAQEGGRYDGVEVIKSRLLPWLETAFTAASLGKPIDSKVPSLQDTFERERQKEAGARDREMKQLEVELSSTHNQINQIQDDLPDSPKTLEATKNRSAISLLAAEEEINQLKKQLKSLQAQEESRHRGSAHRASVQKSSERGVEPRGVEPRGPERRTSELRRSEHRSSEKRSGLDKRISGLDRRDRDRDRDRDRERCDPEVISDYEKQVRSLKDEIAALTAEKSALQESSPALPTPLLTPARNSRWKLRRGERISVAPAAVTRWGRNNSTDLPHCSVCTSFYTISSPRLGHEAKTTWPLLYLWLPGCETPGPPLTFVSFQFLTRNVANHQCWAHGLRQAKQCLLRQCIDNAETVQRIIYIATVEAFHVAKMAFRHFKIRVRKSLTPSYMGANDFEDAVTDYIICHLDLYDSQNSVNDVIRAMNVNPKISFPPEVDFCLLSNFIQEICCIAFAMQTLEPPLDIAFGADGEMFNDCKYRRSYDSDFTAPLVFYHVWPALMENDNVVMKGEAVTKRGAFWNSVRPLSRSRSRSLSPICPRSRIGMSLISRSRSPSPIRCALPSKWAGLDVRYNSLLFFNAPFNTQPCAAKSMFCFPGNILPPDTLYFWMGGP
ncbi:Mitochondria-eating protein [Myotis davidii]|uniref:Mitochondria-eating protein n=1 Tax=Myotis davidii TaxID=225400 RepID=L5M8S5_MYODS|nr:Mitochondria-eating protein [Myotis davidii]